MPEFGNMGMGLSPLRAIVSHRPDSVQWGLVVAGAGAQGWCFRVPGRVPRPHPHTEVLGGSGSSLAPSPFTIPESTIRLRSRCILIPEDKLTRANLCPEVENKLAVPLTESLQNLSPLSSIPKEPKPGPRAPFDSQITPLLPQQPPSESPAHGSVQSIPGPAYGALRPRGNQPAARPSTLHPQRAWRKWLARERGPRATWPSAHAPAPAPLVLGASGPLPPGLRNTRPTENRAQAI